MKRLNDDEFLEQEFDFSKAVKKPVDDQVGVNISLGMFAGMMAGAMIDRKKASEHNPDALN